MHWKSFACGTQAKMILNSLENRSIRHFPRLLCYDFAKFVAL